MQREEKRQEDNRAYVEAEVESLKSRIRDLEEIKKVAEQLHIQRQQDIVKSAQRQQEIIDAAEKRSRANDDDEERSEVDLLDDGLDGLEMTV